MKKLGKVTSIFLQEHLELIVFLNRTVGSSAGSSDKENLLPRVYRKWNDALPNLEEAPLFRILGGKKGCDEGIGRTYQFTDAEKDSWANLFEYKGSGENVRLTMKGRLVRLCLFCTVWSAGALGTIKAENLLAKMWPFPKVSI